MFSLEQRCQYTHFVGLFQAAPWVVCHRAQGIDPRLALFAYNS
jgi:hypothetical protein